MTALRQPRVSVGLPVHNGESYLAEALDSLLAQTFTNFEIVISDNASTDATAEICIEYAEKDPRVRYFRNAENLGLAPNFNRTFELAHGEYFRWHAHDDVCEPTLLEQCVAALEANPAAAMVYPAVSVIDETGAPLAERPTWADDSQRYDGAVVDRFRRFVRPDRGSSIGIFIFGLYRTVALRNTRLMMSHQWADETCLAEVLLEGPLIHIPAPLLHLRVFPGHATAVMAERDLKGWQRILDPRQASGLRFWIARYRRYPEYFTSVLRARGITPRSRLALILHCATVLLRRALALGWLRTLLGRSR